MAKEALLDPVGAQSSHSVGAQLIAPLPPDHIHRIRAELPPEEAAADYERTLRRFFPAGEPHAATAAFDLVLLGMGEDGHTASLFPGAAVLHERERWVVSYYVNNLKAWRITLTLAAVNAARRAVFIVSGAGKAETVRRVLSGPHCPNVLPAQAIDLPAGDVIWMLDAAAAALLSLS